jgi:hypothetical protein
MDARERTRLTFFYERWRAGSQGVLETAGNTFLLLIAVQGMDAGPVAKALVASGGSLGLLLSPLVVAHVERSGLRTARAAGALAFFGCGLFLLMAAAPVLWVFVAGSLLTMAAASAAVPLLTQMYQENYPEKSRGQFFSKTVMIRIAAAALFSEVGGRILSGHFERSRLLLLIFAGAYLVSGLCLWRCPSEALAPSGAGHPFKAMKLLRADPAFRYTLICWMLMGFANLMMLPLRVEYLANPKYGIGMTPAEVAFIAGVAPNAARLLVSPLWGWLFDRVNFFALRAVLNLGFAFGVLAFFTSNDLAGWLLGAVMFGIATAGGDVAWGLWVTKFAPPARVAEYMSVHTFPKGVRGVVAPAVAFMLLDVTSLAVLGWISAAMIGVSSLMLLPEVIAGPPARPGPPLVEEVGE